MPSTAQSPLPLEILHFICSELPTTQDVVNFRLVSRTFAAIGVVYLIPKLTFTFLPDSIQRLLHVCQHPVLRHYIRTLVCIPSIVPFYTYDEYKNSARKPEFLLDWPLPDDHEQQLRRKISDKELAQGWTNFQALINRDFESSRLEQAIGSLSNLQCMRLQCMNISESTQSMLRRLLHGTFLEPEAIYNSEAVCQVLKLVAKLSLTSLSIDILDPEHWQFIPRLRRLKVLLTPVEDVSFGEAAQAVTKKFQLPLALEDLELHFLTDPDELFLANIDSFWDRSTRRPLRTIELSGIDMDHLLFAEFLKAHPSIKSLSLSDCNLTSGIWSEVLLNLPDLELELGKLLFRLREANLDFPYIDTSDVVADTDLTIGVALAAVLSLHTASTENSHLIRDFVEDLVDHPPPRTIPPRSITVPARNSKLMNELIWSSCRKREGTVLGNPNRHWN